MLSKLRKLLLLREVLIAVMFFSLGSVLYADEKGLDEPEETKQQESFSDSVSNIWNIVSDNVSKAAKVSADKVKEVSVDVGKKVSDTAVDAWDKSVAAYNEYTADDPQANNSAEQPLENFGDEDVPADNDNKSAAENTDSKDASVPPIPVEKDSDEKKN